MMLKIKLVLDLSVFSLLCFEFMSLHQGASGKPEGPAGGPGPQLSSYSS